MRACAYNARRYRTAGRLPRNRPHSRRLARHGLPPSKDYPEARIAGNATVVGDVAIGKDALILFNATLRGDEGARIEVGEESNVQESCCLHVGSGHDCIIGRGVTVGHGAIVHGCTVGDGTLVGMGSIVMNGAVIGKNCIIGAGALVTEGMQVPDGMLALGFPAKVRRPLSQEEIAQTRTDAEHYVAIGKNLVENGIVYRGADLPENLPTIAVLTGSSIDMRAQ